MFCPDSPGKAQGPGSVSIGLLYLPLRSLLTRYVGEQKHSVKTALLTPILEFKALVATETGVPADQQRLIYLGKVLKDHETLAFYKVQDGHAIHMVKSSAKKPAASTSTPAAPTNLAAGTAANDPLAGLTDARYAGFGAQLPSTAGMFGPDGMPSEDLLSSAMDNPVFQESMNMLLDNPALLDQMIAQHPVLRLMGPQARELMQSPMFREMIRNPQLMRQAMQAQSALGGMGGMGGMGGLGGMGGFPAPGGGFPAPGNADGSSTTNENASSATNTSPGSGSGSGSGFGSGAANPFAAMFPGLGAGGLGAGGMPNFSELMQAVQPPQAQNNSNRPPEELYELQLRQLNDMGFTNFEQNVAALRRSGGSVQGAIDNLLGGM